VKRTRSKSRTPRLRHHSPILEKHGRELPTRSLRPCVKSPGESAQLASNKAFAELEQSVIRGISRLERLVSQADPPTSRKAFKELLYWLYYLIDWLYWTALRSDVTLDSLLRTLPEKDARARYKQGEHPAAWAGIELARLYRGFKAELASRSSKSFHRLRCLQSGFKDAHLDCPANVWFCSEYKRDTDYRPTGEMAVWVALKIDEIRAIKSHCAYWRQFLPEDEIEQLVDGFGSELVGGTEFRKQLDALPLFGGPESDLKVWRSFVRGRLLKQNHIMTEFDLLFPKQRRKLDGLITATLRHSWKATKDGGSVVLPYSYAAPVVESRERWR